MNWDRFQCEITGEIGSKGIKKIKDDLYCLTNTSNKQYNDIDGTNDIGNKISNRKTVELLEQHRPQGQEIRYCGQTTTNILNPYLRNSVGDTVFLYSRNTSTEPAKLVGIFKLNRVVMAYQLTKTGDRIDDDICILFLVPI